MGVVSLIAGFGAGIIGGLLGLGGGIILVPILSEILNLPQVKAHATSIVIIFFTGLFGTLSYLKFGEIPPVPALCTSLGTLITVPFGVLSAHKFGEKRLRRAFAFFLIILSITMLLSASPEPHRILPSMYLLYFLVGALVGFLSPLLGIGGGTILVPTLVLLFGLEQHAAQGVSLSVMIPMTLLASLINFRLKNIEFKVVPLIIIGIMIGTTTGSLFAHSLNSYVLKKIFGGFLLLLSLRYIFNSTKYVIQQSKNMSRIS